MTCQNCEHWSLPFLYQLDYATCNYARLTEDGVMSGCMTILVTGPDSKVTGIEGQLVTRKDFKCDGYLQRELR
jgi:hypothetical protein